MGIGHTPILEGHNDGHAFIIKLKVRHMKHFMMVLPLS